MNRPRVSNLLLIGLPVILGGSLGYSSAYLGRSSPQDRNITITARQYAYDPAIIEVNEGDRLHIRLASTDVTHGFYLEGYDLDAKVRREDPSFWVRHPSAKDESYESVQEITVVANRTGKFRYRCSITCGTMHPFMNGVLIVRPNNLYRASLGISVGLLAGVLLAFRSKAKGV